MKYTVFIILSLGFCNLFGQPQLKKAFSLGEKKDFIAASCELLPECDCCSADLILLTASKFAIVDRCVDGDTFYAGTYTIKASILTLIFEQKVVNEEADKDTNNINPKLRAYELRDQSFDIKPCGGNLILVNRNSFYDFGVSLDQKAELELRKELANSRAFKMLDQ